MSIAHQQSVPSSAPTCSRSQRVSRGSRGSPTHLMVGKARRRIQESVLGEHSTLDRRGYRWQWDFTRSRKSRASLSYPFGRFRCMVVDIATWLGVVARSRRDPTAPVVIEVPIMASPRGGSGTFLAADNDGDQWWVKPLNNRQGERVTVTEAVVASVGTLIEAPVCESTVVYLPPDIEGWEFRPGSAIESGYAHASRSIANAFEDRSLLYRDRDDNARRHVGVFALYDWCWGGDDQWLYAEPTDRQLFSHDHGWYLPETGATWDIASLNAHVDEAHPPRWSADGLDLDELSLDPPMR